MAGAADKEEALKRLGGGRWQTRDERFTIEPQSGTWVVVDAEQVDDLGLPLVRGPFGSLGAAKAAIAEARGSEPLTSPLQDRAERLKGASSPPTATKGKAPDTAATPATPSKPAKRVATATPPEPREPRWIIELEGNERRRARRLLERLTAASAPDAEGLARRDIVGQVPAVAGLAVARRIRALGPAASPTTVAGVLLDGRDDDLGVRWRLVDGDGRPITVDLEAIDAAEDR